MNFFLSELLSVLLAFVFAFALPLALLFLCMRNLRSVEKARTKNYAGRVVVYGLGIVWLFWAVGLSMQSALEQFIRTQYFHLPDTLRYVSNTFSISDALKQSAAPLVVLCFAFGFVDDAFGDADARGFKGHLKALLHGRLTTGGLKLIGIASAAVLSAYTSHNFLNPGRDVSGWTFVLFVVLTGAAIALSSNLINLCDLRPIRAGKVYLLLLALGTPFLFARSGIGFFDKAESLIWLLGPLLAIWYYDARELAMLGDAGANPMGALAGLYITFGMSLPGLIIYVVLLLVLNLASEKVSFSAVIEGSPLLRAFDQLGRPKTLPADNKNTDQT